MHCTTAPSIQRWQASRRAWAPSRPATKGRLRSEPTCAAPASCIASPKCCFTSSKCSSLRPATRQCEGAGVVTPPGMLHKPCHLQQLPDAQECRRRGMRCHAAVSCGACFEYQGCRARCISAALVVASHDQQHTTQPRPAVLTMPALMGIPTVQLATTQPHKTAQTPGWPQRVYSPCLLIRSSCTLYSAGQGSGRSCRYSSGPAPKEATNSAEWRSFADDYKRCRRSSSATAKAQYRPLGHARHVCPRLCADAASPLARTPKPATCSDAQLASGQAEPTQHTRCTQGGLRQPQKQRGAASPDASYLGSSAPPSTYVTKSGNLQ